MKAGLILLGLAAIYLVGQLFMVWRSRNANLPKTPPGGWKKRCVGQNAMRNEMYGVGNRVWWSGVGTGISKVDPSRRPRLNLRPNL